jgi:hypothetical protein
MNNDNKTHYMKRRILEAFIILVTLIVIVSQREIIHCVLKDYGVYYWLGYTFIVILVLAIIHVFSMQDKNHIVVSNDRTNHDTADILSDSLILTYVEPILFMDTAWISKFTYRGKLIPHDAYYKDIQTKLFIKGWRREECFDKKYKNNSFGFRFDVWINENSKQIVIAFRGTVFLNLFSLFANLHWISRYWFFTRRLSHYDIIKDHFPSLVTEIKKSYENQHYKFYSTGHSLGGGLAIHCSYCIEEIGQVYAYDASPVTGWFEISSELRKKCTKNLVVHTFYESAELLYYLRKFTQLSYLLNTTTNKDPYFIEYRANFHKGISPIPSHGMAHIVDGFEEALGIPKTQN